MRGCDLTYNSKHTRIISRGFIDKGTGKHQSNLVYDSNGISPALNAGDYKSPIKIIDDGGV